MMSLVSVILILALHLLQEVKGSIQLNNNGYDGIAIAINPNIPEDKNIIQNIKDMVTEASTYLFHATGKRVYFRNVSILIPLTWTQRPEYLTPRLESYDKADVIVADPYLKYGNDPYTLQYRPCRVFVHEWAHLRWGVFDEYNIDKPFYISSQGTIEATRCSADVTGENIVQQCQGRSCINKPCRFDQETGLYEARCTFVPQKTQYAKESIMFMQSLDSVVEFCNAETHNTEAPNLQNKMCNHRSTWDVIMNSSDFNNLSPMAKMDRPLPTVFSLLQTKDRVACLVLDKSGSMSQEDRLNRMNQAAQVFLLQIVEVGSWVGMVTFDSVAQVQNNLSQIVQDDVRDELSSKLPKVADGGTSICSGLQLGFQVITQHLQTTEGSEIILLTDGEDSTMSSCFQEVKQSGAIIHTIALGKSAAKELEELANMTGGLRFSATDEVDQNGLIDAFSGLPSRSGNSSQRAIQVESTGLSLRGRQWLNGTVIIDSAIGNDTFFVVTWTTQTPEIFLRDPKGKIYQKSQFKIGDDLAIRTARLQIPGRAETGTWMYHLQNTSPSPQVLTMTVTSRAHDPQIPPIITTTHLSQTSAQFPSPMIIYCQVHQGFLPVLGANVTAIIEAGDGHVTTMALWDNGAGADVIKNDGIYSRYFTISQGNGRYSLKVRAQAKKNTARLGLRHHHSQALYIPGKTVMNPPRPEVKDDSVEVKAEDFGRTTSGGSFVAWGVPASPFPDVFPPSKIIDLEGKFEDDHVLLSWTAPGDDYDTGRGKLYKRISKNLLDLRDKFDHATLVNTSGLIPKDANIKETFTFKLETFKIENGTKIYVAIWATDEANHKSDVSNIVHLTKFIPPERPCSNAPNPNFRYNPIISISTIIWVAVGLVAALYSALGKVQYNNKWIHSLPTMSLQSIGETGINTNMFILININK
uniref:VWFA domain-containing protein n=1 Tax=Ornithorhynchus anatinus TaxID=9258 RepID=F7DX63_ORNAN